MTQRPSQADNVQLNGIHVTQYIHAMQQRDAAIMQTFKACRDTLMDAANLYIEEKDEALTAKLRDQLVELIQVEHEVDHHKAALGQLQCNYQPSLDKTDFEEDMQEYMQQAQATDRFDPAADDDVKLFDEMTGKEQQQEEQEMGDDEELLVMDNASSYKNDKCPYTLKDVADLDDPVEDEKGFIYERKAIVAALQHEQRAHRMNWIECPLPGVAHAVMLHQLKPVNKRRLQLQAMRSKQTQPERRGVVL